MRALNEHPYVHELRIGDKIDCAGARSIIEILDIKPTRRSAKAITITWKLYINNMVMSSTENADTLCRNWVFAELAKDTQKTDDKYERLHRLFQAV